MRQPIVACQGAAVYIAKANVGKPGACHAFRHAAATAMLENGADIRFIQELLGHAALESTQVYTHVAIGKLKAVHDATRPAAKLEKPKTEAADPGLDGVDPRAALFDALAAEAEEEDG